jgi:hypothetical protein
MTPKEIALATKLDCRSANGPMLRAPMMVKQNKLALRQKSKRMY